MTVTQDEWPDTGELRRRTQLALSILDHRGHTPESAELVERTLRGEQIESLLRSEGG